MRCTSLLIAAAALAAAGLGLAAGRGSLEGAPGQSKQGSTRGTAPTAAERLNPLLGLVRRSDAIVEGRIESAVAFSLDPGDGAPMVLTEVVVRGRRLGGTAVAPGPGDRTPAAAGDPAAPATEPALHTFLVHGGLLEDGLGGSFVPDAPARHELRVGRGVVAFCANAHARMATGRDLDGVMPIGGRAGLFNTFEARSGEVIVQGRGLGSAIPVNIRLPDLVGRIGRLAGPPTEDDR